jgi:predicted SAM-dependent methyltransferase
VRRVLHAGCGNEPLPALFKDVEEVRLDADESVKPDIVASFTNLGDIGEFDDIWCSHSLEHLHPIDVITALKEFHRVLKPEGACLIVVPDVEGVLPTFDPLPGQVVCGHDLIYGRNDTYSNPWMLHRTGFIEKTLRGAMMQSGFGTVHVKRFDYTLMGIGTK